MNIIGITEIDWQSACRIVPSIFPPINLFERVTDPADLEAVLALESMTNDRVRDEVGNLNLIAPEDRISGAGTSAIMAAFTHLNPCGSRFSDGSYGVFYAAQFLDTAIAETRYHRECFLRATQEAPIDIDMRVYTVDIKAPLHDIRGKQAHYPELYHPSSYHSSQHFGRELRAQNAFGVVYHSVRCDNGVNAAVFRPKSLSNCRQERHLCYKWDGKSISMIIKKEIYIQSK